jgi:hypothetical protein
MLIFTSLKKALSGQSGAHAAAAGLSIDTVTPCAHPVTSNGRFSRIGCVSGQGASKIAKVVPTPTLLFTSILLP